MVVMLVLVLLVLLCLTVRREIAIGFMCVLGRGRRRSRVVTVDGSRGGLAKGVSLARDFCDVSLKVLDDDTLLLDDLPELVVLRAERVALGEDLLNGSFVVQIQCLSLLLLLVLGHTLIRTDVLGHFMYPLILLMHLSTWYRNRKKG